ncbi:MULTISPECIES: 5'-nucleotidase C-terminal domain-containing protein [unclassified Clostridium]|uniref:5'-nucleotidase C-terminal domain-containing protein n=1 Tax=unclassified Clostridium TaxID=2614128 RepID=UPI001C8C2294|nr:MULTISPECIES: 5'-nucleotidase C-terminal domain-containing protein [unclassified Clostridium]MBX9137460.1 LPXTG cell wall anchor domain-containing protein [Clostridium sp. K12(2020)]MBX9144216.1 LPXTG cell wall anchor domain-containing protein [Clostridium sp. K13]
MLKNKGKLIAIITTLTISAGLITPVKIVKADEINVEVVQNIENGILSEEENSDSKSSNKVVEILSFNDFHGNVLESGKNIGAAKLTGIIKEYQKRDEASDTYGVATVSGGDIYQGTAISNILAGEPVSKMLEEIGIVASAIGNHEYDWGSDKIKPWAEEAGFKFVAANLIDETTGVAPEYAEPYVMTNVDGINIAFIGIATPETLTSTKAENVVGLKFLDIVETIDKYSEIVRAEGADIVVALTHSPALENSDGSITGEAAEIAKNAADVDAVVAAHNHKFVDGFVNNNNTGKDVPVVQAGYNGRGLSVITFTFDENEEILDVEANTRQFYAESSTNEFPIDKNVEETIAKYNEQLAPTLLTEVTELKFDLDHDRYAGVTPLGVTVAEAMRQEGGTQVAIANGGGIRAPLTKGTLTLGDMYTILPFDNNVVTMKVTGAKLKELIQHGINPDGFGWGQYSGLTVWYDSETDEITSMRLSDGTKVEEDKYYTLTSIDFLMTGGDSYNFDGHIDPVIIGEMRDIVINQWENGIDKLNYNLLIDGEDTAVIPEAMSGIIDTTIVTLINGDGSYESPLEMKINDVEINKIKSFLNNLKQLGNIEIETEENGEYTVFKIKISLADKSLENLYITFNVDNTLVEIIEAVNELKENNSVDPNPEETPEIKPEVVPGGSGNENNAGSNNTEGVDKLPQTGAPISSAQVVFIALVITTIGFVVLKKKENVA